MKRREVPLRLWKSLIAALVLVALISSIPLASAPPPGACSPWPDCKGGGGGGDTEASYWFEVTIVGTYNDPDLGERSFTVSIDSDATPVAKSFLLNRPSIMVTGLAETYRGQAGIWTSPDTTAVVADHTYATLTVDFGGFVYSQTWEASSSNDFRTRKPLERLKMGERVDVISFDIFVAERRVWNEPYGAADYDLFLSWRSIVSGQVTRVSDTEWHFEFAVVTDGEVVFQRYAWSDYGNRIRDWQNTVNLRPTVTYWGDGTLTKVT